MKQAIWRFGNLAIWEELHNPNFNRVEFEAVTKNAGKTGRYVDTYAHSDIAFEFASWISVEFKSYIITIFKKGFCGAAGFNPTAGKDLYFCGSVLSLIMASI